MFLNVDVEAADIIDSLVCNLDREELVSFVITLDSYTQDWDFTESLYAYFKKEHKTFKEEQKYFNE